MDNQLEHQFEIHKEGQGKMLYATSGAQYEGTWLNDKHHGFGIIRNDTTGEAYKGEWYRGKRHGRGK